MLSCVMTTYSIVGDGVGGAVVGPLTSARIGLTLPQVFYGMAVLLSAMAVAFRLAFKLCQKHEDDMISRRKKMLDKTMI